MATERVAYVNGQMVPESEAVISIRDRGFLQGDAVFDTTRTFGHRIFRLDEHLTRFMESLKYMRIEPGLTKDDFVRLTMEVLNANLPLLDADDDYWVTQRVTRGVTVDGVDKPSVVIECVPLPFKARARYYRDGIPVVVPSVRRTPPESNSPRAKVHNYVNLVQATLEVTSQGADNWPILLDTNGNLSEGPGSNLFIVKNGAVITPKEQYVLAGISRRVTIELAQELGIEVHEADIDLFDAYTADEAFVTSTSFCICPVSSFNGSPVADGSVPRPVTDRLTRAYSGMVGIDVTAQYLARL